MAPMDFHSRRGRPSKRVALRRPVCVAEGQHFEGAAQRMAQKEEWDPA
jgi:hypothetical protein